MDRDKEGQHDFVGVDWLKDVRTEFVEEGASHRTKSTRSGQLHAAWQEPEKDARDERLERTDHTECPDEHSSLVAEFYGQSG